MMKCSDSPTLKSIMIVDDMEPDRYITKWSIEKNNLAKYVLEVEDGELALDYFLNYEKSLKQYGDRFPPTLILLDINMPKMSGFEFLEKFATERDKNPEHYDLVVIMMFTSSVHTSDREKALKYSFVKDYLTKPVTPEGLAHILSKHFS